MIGNKLEDAGWRQGSVVKPSDIRQLLDAAGTVYKQDIVVLVASQSCDVANNNLGSEPYVELSVARKIDGLNGQLTHNKNPRALHIQIMCRTGDSIVSNKEYVELKAYEKITIPKQALVTLQPDFTRVLEERQAQSYVSWLAARYSRPALPTAFNDLFSKADPKNKLRNKAKKCSHELVGIYVELNPDTELKDGQTYDVNLLGLLPAGFNEDTSKAQNAINSYADIFRASGMNVTAVLETEDNVSVALIRRFKRFYLDDLSFRDGSPHPPETKTVL